MQKKIRPFLGMIVAFLCFTATVAAQQFTQHIGSAELTFLEQREVLWNPNPSISVQFQNTPLEEVLVTITDLAKAGLYFSSEQLPDKRISLNAVDTPVSDILQTVLEGTGLEASSSGRNIILKDKQIEEGIEYVDVEDSEEFQESIQGQVTDSETGEALPGVNIIVQGTTTGTSTDVYGHFELVVPSLEETLVISYIGYVQQEILIDGRHEVNVSMTSQAVVGEDIVVIGYRTQRRESVTGSLASVQMDECRGSAVTGVDQALTG